MFKILLLLCMLIICVCNSDRLGQKKSEKASETMNRVEVLLSSSPDSALVLLGSIDKEVVTSKKEQARYSLLYSELLDKNCIDLETDSVIRPAVEYFSRHGKHEDRAKMYYYLGRIYSNAGRMEEAVEAFVQAGEYVGEEQHNLQGLIYSGIGYLYDAQISAKEALDMFAKASDAFQKAGNRRNRSYTLREEGDALIDLEDKELANRRLYESLEISRQLKDTINILSLTLKIATNLIFYFEDIPQAKKLLSDIYTQYHAGNIPQDDYLLWGYVYMQEKNLQKAEYYFQNRSELGSNPHFMIGVYDLWRMLYEEKKEYRKALDYANRESALRDSVYSMEKDKLVQNLERKYRTELLRTENEKLQAVNVYLAAIFFLIFFFFAFVLIQFVYRARRKEREKEERISSLKRVLDDWINFLKILANMAVKTKKDPGQFLETFKENLNLKSGKKQFFSDLQTLVNQSHNGIVDYLKKEYPYLTYEDLDFCCLLYLKMPMDVMLLMYDFTNKNSLYNKRSDLRKKLALSSESDLEQHLDKLLENLIH